MAKDTREAVEFMERLIETIGLRPGLPQAVEDEKFASLYAEAKRALPDPDMCDAACEYLDRWRNQLDHAGPT